MKSVLPVEVLVDLPALVVDSPVAVPADWDHRFMRRPDLDRVSELSSLAPRIDNFEVELREVLGVPCGDSQVVYGRGSGDQRVPQV